MVYESSLSNVMWRNGAQKVSTLFLVTWLRKQHAALHDSLAKCTCDLNRMTFLLEKPDKHICFDPLKNPSLEFF